MSRRNSRALLAASALLWLMPPLRDLVEADMALQMLVQFPLLLAAGWAAAAYTPRWLVALQTRIDAQGLTSATLASCVSAFWMIPAALDLAVLDPRVAALKYASWPLAGAAVASGWSRLGPVPAAFFLGNAAWMLVTAGLLYREAETRLCVSYPLSAQTTTGTGLVIWGLVLGAIAVAKLRGFGRQALPERENPDSGRSSTSTGV
ncbi:MAG: hypothetical protein KIT73_18015 [Burkholderiales bacterium]|nr:hypothetical protein [Burkholderiales bacterium]